MTETTPQPKHVMIDIETLGTGEDAAILSIGATRFEPLGDPPSDHFYVAVSLHSNLDYGRVIDADTLMWWLKAENRDALSHITTANDPLDLPTALWGLEEWMGDPTNVWVWANGASFDHTIIGNAYKSIGQPRPYPFYMERCHRTLRVLVPQIERPKIEGTAHNALDDAIAQAQHAQAMFRFLHEHSVH